MVTATFKAGTLACLLVFAVVCCGGRSAWAQLDCPLPDGVAPPASPPEESSHSSCLFRQEGSPFRSGST